MSLWLQICVRSLHTPGALHLCFHSTTEILLNLGLLDRRSPDRTYSQCPQPGLHSLCEISTRPQLNCLCNQGPAAGSYSRMCSRVLRQHQRLSRLYLACCCWSLQNWEDTRFWDRISKLLHLTVYRRIPLLCNPPW